MRHLSLEEVRFIHALTIEQYGGSSGERDPAALESAIAQPAAEYFGVAVHPTVAAQASAYLYHLCQAHAFVDGNKRTAVFAMLAFLELNGLALHTSDDELFQLVVSVARGNLEKSAVTDQLQLWLERDVSVTDLT
jgi:death on curing protein